MKVKARAAKYALINDALYRRSFFDPYQRSVLLKKAKQIIEKIHGCICGTHIDGRSLCHRIMTWFYWPTMKHESKLFMRNCDVCQKSDNIIHVPTTTLHSMSSPWPFYKWEIDIVGLLPLASGQRKFILVAIDYFIKWAEVEAYAQIKVTQLIQLMQKNIVRRFRVPYSIILDNGLQFISKPFQ